MPPSRRTRPGRRLLIGAPVVVVVGAVDQEAAAVVVVVAVEEVAHEVGDVEGEDREVAALDGLLRRLDSYATSDSGLTSAMMPDGNKSCYAIWLGSICHVVCLRVHGMQKAASM